MGQIKHKMGKVGGGVDISHKSKMSNAAKNQMSYPGGMPGGMPGPGDYGQMEQPAKIVGKGMARYLAGESVGMRRMDPMYNGKAGTQPDDFLQFDASKSTGPGKKKRKLTAEQQKLVNEIRSKRAKKEQASKDAKIQKKKVNKELDTFLKAGGEVSSGPGKYTRAKKTKEKAQDAKEAADQKINAPYEKTPYGVKVMERSKRKADRLAKRQKRQEGRAERKTIRKNKDLSRGDKRKQIIDSREKQNSTKKKDTKTGGSGMGMPKTDPNEVVVSGDKNKVNNKVTKTNNKDKRREKKEDQKKIMRALLDEKKKERENKRKVAIEKKLLQIQQNNRKKAGKDYQANTGEDNQKTIRRS